MTHISDYVEVCLKLYSKKSHHIENMIYI